MCEKEIKIIKYESSQQKAWDNFVDKARNAYFFFKRDFMEYHSDRFEDSSLMIYEGGKLLALLPAHVKEGKLYSHMGLTFAGFILSDDLKQVKMIRVLEEIRNHLVTNNLDEFIYKAMPHVYHLRPCEEDVVALYKAGASLDCRDLTSVIKLGSSIKFSKGKRSLIKKAKETALVVSESKDFESFFAAMIELLSAKYEAKPVHSLEEMKMLADRFPENIKLYTASLDSKFQAGTILFIDKNIVKTQYITSTEEGRKHGAVDLLMDYLINDLYRDKEYFDFGTSTEKNELGFNESLLAQKELFGARVIAKDVYSLKVNKETQK